MALPRAHLTDAGPSSHRTAPCLPCMLQVEAEVGSIPMVLIQNKVGPQQLAKALRGSRSRSRV